MNEARRKERIGRSGPADDARRRDRDRHPQRRRRRRPRSRSGRLASPCRANRASPGGDGADGSGGDARRSSHPGGRHHRQPGPCVGRGGDLFGALAFGAGPLAYSFFPRTARAWRRPVSRLGCSCSRLYGVPCSPGFDSRRSLARTEGNARAHALHPDRTLGGGRPSGFCPPSAGSDPSMPVQRRNSA